jgi:hypothetical protein
VKAHRCARAVRVHAAPLGAAQDPGPHEPPRLARVAEPAVRETVGTGNVPYGPSSVCVTAVG